MEKKITKVEIPKNTEGGYKITLYKYSKYLTNHRNILFFEYTDKQTEENPEFAELNIFVKDLNSETHIPPGYSFLCSYYCHEFDKHLFVYFQDTVSSLLGNFMGMFGDTKMFT